MNIRVQVRSPLIVEPEPLCPEAVVLIYELLDAHDDTARLASDVASDSLWEAHLGYLRDLQRIGREVLGRTSAGWRG